MKDLFKNILHFVWLPVFLIVVSVTIGVLCNVFNSLVPLLIPLGVFTFICLGFAGNDIFREY